MRTIGRSRCRARWHTIGRVVAAAVILTLTPPPLYTQEVTGPALKAAFLFNFVKFTTWPPDALADAAPVQMCVFNAPAVGSALKDTVQGRVVAGHPIEVAQPTDAAGLRRCHVLFVSGPRAAALDVVAGLQAAPVLTVSDLPSFTAEGGVAQLHIKQGQLRFAFALETARLARLQISSKLLLLARQP